jgi:hypothetical protein
MDPYVEPVAGWKRTRLGAEEESWGMDPLGMNAVTHEAS